MENFLTIPEEILLLAINDSGGQNPQFSSYEVVLASSILMDLAIRNRIDTDLQQLIHVSNEPTGDPVLDDILGFIFSIDEHHEPAHWVGQVGMRADELVETIIAALVVKKVLKVENQKILWVFSSRRYPVIKDVEVKEVKSRVRDLVFGNEIPDLRDIVIVSLLNYGSLLPLIFSDEEVKKYRGRIEQIAKMDLIGQAITKSLSEFSIASQKAAKARTLIGGKTPEQKLEQIVTETKTKFRIRREEDLPEWLRKGTAQYKKTIEFIAEKGTADVFYHPQKKQYFVKKFSAGGHVFGSGA